MNRKLLIALLALPMFAQVAPIFPTRVVTDADMYPMPLTAPCLTNLAQQIGPDDTSFDVVSAATCPTANFQIQIENEIIAISSVSGVTMTVASGGRGFATTTATGHIQGLAIKEPYYGQRHDRIIAEIEAIETAIQGGGGGGGGGGVTTPWLLTSSIPASQWHWTPPIFTNIAAVDFNTNAYPAGSYVQNNPIVFAFRSAIVQPATAGGIGSAGGFFAQSQKANGFLLTMFSLATAGTTGGELWSYNANVSDCTTKNTTDSGSICYGQALLEGIETDTTIGSPNTTNAIRYSANNLPGSLYQASTADIGYYVGKPADTIGALTYFGTSGLNDFAIPATARWSGNNPLTWAFLVDSTGTPDTYRYTPINYPTGTDLIIGALNTVSAATHNFTLGDVGGTVRVQVISGSGCTPGDFTVLSVLSGVATLDSSPGITGRTCTYALWAATGVAMTGGNQQMTLPQDLSPSATLAGAATRPLATSYGLTGRFSATTGHTLNDYWKLSVVGVPTMHWSFHSAPGASDIGMTLGMIYYGVNMPSQALQFEATDQSGNARLADITAQPATGGSRLQLSWPAANDGGVDFAANVGGTYTPTVKIINNGDIFAGGNLFGIAAHPAISTDAGVTLTAAQTIYAIIARTGLTAPRTDTTPSAAALVASLNANRAGACYTGTTFPFVYVNGSANQASIVAGSGISFSPSGTWVVPIGASREVSVAITNCTSGAEAAVMYSIGAGWYDGPRVNGVAYPAVPAATGTIPVMTSISGGGTVTYQQSPLTLLGGTANQTGVANATTNYIGAASSAFGATESAKGWISPIAGTVKSLYIQCLGNTQDASGSSVWHVMKNGVASTITVTFASGDGACPYQKSDTTHSFTVAAGDRITLRDANGASAGTAITYGGYSLFLAP